MNTVPKPKKDYGPARTNGKFAPGYSGNPGGNDGRARKALNAETIRQMHEAFREHGRSVINRVIKDKPDVFLKLLVLLIPREMQMEHKGGVKAMTDEELERGIELLTAAIQARANGDNAKVVEADAEPAALPAPPRKPSANA